MTLLLFALVAVGFILIFKAAQQSTPVQLDVAADTPVEAVEYFWRPG